MTWQEITIIAKFDESLPTLTERIAEVMESNFNCQLGMVSRMPADEYKMGSEDEDLG